MAIPEVELMNYRTSSLLKTSIALVALTLFSIYAYLGIYLPGKNKKRIDFESRLVFDFSQNQIQKVVVERGNERTVARRSGVDSKGQPLWKLIEPVTDQADGITLNSLIGIIQRLQTIRVITTSERQPLSSYGLDPPRGRIQLSGTEKDQNNYKLLIGNKSTYDNLLYLKKEDDHGVLVVEGYLEKSLMKTAFELRRKKFIDIDKTQVKQIKLIAAKNRIELQLQEKKWYINYPKEELADQEAISNIFDSLSSLLALNYPQDPEQNLENYGLNSPVYSVEIHYTSNIKPLIINFGQKTDPFGNVQLFVQTSYPDSFIAVIDNRQLIRLGKELFELQDKSPIKFIPEAVTKIKATNDSNLIVLEKKEDVNLPPDDISQSPGKSWHLVSPRAQKVEAEKVLLLLQNLSAIRATRFAPENIFSKNLLWTITTTTEDGASLVLKIGDVVTDGVLVLGSSLDKICIAPKQTIARIEDLINEIFHKN